MKDYIDDLLAEQKQKTREDTIDEIKKQIAELNGAELLKALKNLK